MSVRRYWTATSFMLVAAVILLPNFVGAIESERQWMRENGQKNGEGPGIWVWRVPDGPYSSDWPKRSDGTQSDPTKPDTCVGCHYWVEGATITQDGFTNILGETPRVENQDISPKKLLDSAIHTDANGNKTYDNKHAENFDKEGCAACHKQHGPMEGFGCGSATCHASLTDGVPPRFAVLHSIHPVGLEAEQPLGDPEDFKAGKPSCGYCHAPLNQGVGNAACWNCHMSAHRPLQPPDKGGGVAYWKSTPSTPTVPVPGQ